MGRETVFIGLFTFGLIYNWAVSQVHAKGWDEGFVSLLVALGSGVTIGGVAIIDPGAAFLTLIAFGCSGSPMIIGSIVRYVTKRERGQQDIRKGTR